MIQYSILLGGVDVCYDPFGNYTFPPTMAPSTSFAPTTSPAPTPYVELYGDCEFLYPSAAPSPYPTDEPSLSPSALPTFSPSASPSFTPTLSASPTATLMPSFAPTYTGYCEPDEQGLFGEEASNAVSVDYTYELVTDPTQNATLDEVIGVLGQNVLMSMLPTLFSDNCTTAPSRRQLANVTYTPMGVSTSDGDAAIDGGKTIQMATCTCTCRSHSLTKSF
jgi:hypothetical protein